LQLRHFRRLQWASISALGIDKIDNPNFAPQIRKTYGSTAAFGENKLWQGSGAAHWMRRRQMVK
jgi:hypothetical protein